MDALPLLLKSFITYIHPVAMWVLFGLTVYALYTGMKSRQTRKTKGDEKKILLKGKFKHKHFLYGSMVLALMVLGNLGGIGVTYMNNQKLFVDSHLIVGLGMTGLIAIAASLVPFMQQGHQFARDTHIVINVMILGLFGWQAITGMEIVQRIMEQGLA